MRIINSDRMAGMGSPKTDVVPSLAPAGEFNLLEACY
jgi:hypothetical protein